MQIYHFMDYPKASYLDLQFLFPKDAQQAKNIQKTVIFKNTMSMIIQDWMKKLGKS